MQRRFDEILSSLKPGGNILLAVSGGVDSMVMASLFLNSPFGTDFGIAHCNFHLRGEESDSDEALVQEWAESHSIRFHKTDFDTKEYAASRGISIEMAARELRYAWFQKLCEENGYEALAVAHNANDNAETLILNLLRGTGLKGMTGMNPVSSIPCGGTGAAKLIRPLLSFSRAEIKEYAISNGLKWHEDSTNADSAYKRNCIRNEIFPLFERINPSFLATISDDIARFRQERAAADSFIEDAAARVTSPSGDGEILRVDIQKLLSCKLPEYVLFRLLEPWGFNSSSVADILSVISGKGTVSGKEFETSVAKLLTTGKELILTPRLDDNGTGESDSEVVTVTGDGEYSCSGQRFSVRTVSWSSDRSLKQPEGTIILDASALSFPFMVRKWAAGDWMCPLGVRTASGKPGRKKISDMFVDLKKSVSDKEKALVVTRVSEDTAAEASSRVQALLFCRIDDSCKVSASSKTVIVISRI